MVRRFVLAFLAFIALVVPSALLLALLAAPASPAPMERPGCARNLALAAAGMAAMQARLDSLAGRTGPARCAATRLYFLEVVKARAVAALCRDGTERERELGRLDRDVERSNGAIAETCGEASY